MGKTALSRKPSSGFTFVELIIVVSIIAVISAAAIPGFTSYIEGQNLRQSVNQVKDDLRKIQVDAMGGVSAADSGVDYWGARFVANTSFNNTFNVGTYNSSLSFTNVKTSRKLVGNIEIKSNKNILFSMFSGNAFTISSGSLQRCNNSGSNCRVIIGDRDASSGSSACHSVSVNTAGALFKQEGVTCP
jgi:prepilin-type N-terminal cleavage/methylation domain-containing protein